MFECAKAVMLSKLSCPQSVLPSPCSAVAYQRDNVADMLLSQGADLQAQDSQGNTVLHYAAGGLRRRPWDRELLDVLRKGQCPVDVCPMDNRDWALMFSLWHTAVLLVLRIRPDILLVGPHLRLAAYCMQAMAEAGCASAWLRQGHLAL